MWKKIGNKLYHVTDDSRVSFRTNISAELLNKLELLAVEHDTHINYLLESGLENLLKYDFIAFDKNLRPKDRKQYKTTYDKELLKNIKEFAYKNKLYINDVIEHSYNFIEFNKIKEKSYRSRIEK